MSHLKREYGIKIVYRNGRASFNNFEEFIPAESAYYDWSRDLGDEATVSFVVRNVVVADWVESPVLFLGESLGDSREDVVDLSVEQQDLLADLESSLSEGDSLSSEVTLQRFDALAPKPATFSSQEPVSDVLYTSRSAVMGTAVEFVREAVSDIVDSYDGVIPLYDLKVAVLSAEILIAPVYIIEEAFELLARTRWIAVDDSGNVMGCG